MKNQYAFIADVHGNLPALEAVLADIQSRGIRRIFFLGDMVGKGPSVGEIVDLIRQSCEQVVYGNWDRLVSSDYMGHGGPWFRERLTGEQLEYLKALPRDICLDDGAQRIRGYHGRFTIEDIVMPYFGQEAIQRAMDAVGEDSTITVMADAHHPFQVMLGGRMLVNTGSVGNPCDKVAKASYFYLEIDGNNLQASHVRVEYDLEKAVELALAQPDLPMLEAYIDELRQARYMRG